MPEPIPAPRRVRIAALNVFPLKSAQGTTCSSIIVDRRGLANDRRYAFIDPQGRAITLRSHVQLAEVEVAARGHGFELVRNGDRVLVPEPTDRIAVTVHGRPISGLQLSSPALDAWIGRHLPGHTLVDTDPDHARRPTRMPETSLSVCSFVDAYPISLTSTASLDALSALAPAEAGRFRMNLVLDGLQAFEEDTLDRLEIGGIVFHPVKPIDRCSVIGIDPASGVSSRRTLAALTKLRGPIFGIYLAHDRPGLLEVGQEVQCRHRP